MDRDIFTFYNGKKYVKSDPMRIHNAYRKASLKTNVDSIMNRFIGPDWLGDPELTRKFSIPDHVVAQAIDDQSNAIQELVPVLCQMFAVKHLDEDQEDGMTTVELLNAFTEWNNYISSVKKNTEMNASESQDTAIPPTFQGKTDTNDNVGLTLTPDLSTASRLSPSPRPLHSS